MPMTDRNNPGSGVSALSGTAPEACSTAEVDVASTTAAPVSVLGNSSVGVLTTATAPAATTSPRLLPTARGPDPRVHGGKGVQPPGPGSGGSTLSGTALEACSTAAVGVASTASAPVSVLGNSSVGSLTTATATTATSPRLLPTARGPDPRVQGGGGVQPPGPARRTAARTASISIDERGQQGGSVVLPPPGRIANSAAGRVHQSGGSVVRPPLCVDFSGPARSPRTKLNTLCSNCNRNPGTGNLRKRVCPSVQGCPRWVCRQTCNRTFNTHKRFEKRVCCSCHPEIKEICQCRTCKRKRKKRSPDTSTERDVRAKVAEQRGGKAGRRGRSTGGIQGPAFAGRYMVLPRSTPAPQTFPPSILQQRGGSAGCKGRSVGREPESALPGRISSQAGAPQASRPFSSSAVRLPTANDATSGSITVSVCVSATQSRVVTSVNPNPPATFANQDQEPRSSCSRSDCYPILLNSWSVSQTAGTNGGVPSATAGMCRHAEVALQLLQAGKLKEAEPVSFGEGACAFEGFEECVAQAAEKRLLSDEDARTLLKIGVDAKASGVWFLMKLDDWGYAVREGRDRSCELGWAHVKDDNPKKAGASRRITPGRGLMCQCNRGNPCTEYTTGQRRCVHTLLVALALWGAQGRESGGLYAGEEVVGGDGDNGAGGTQRTAQEQLDENPGKYFKGLVNCLNHTSTYRFPEHLPLGMPPAAKGTDTPYTASQEKCSGCGGAFALVETVPATRITAEPRMMARVHVERRECKGCSLYAWASDNWRTTGLFKYNNSYLVEVSILYDCLKAFSKGVPIISFFEMFLEPLDGSLEWGDANPELASRLSTGTNLLNTLENAFLAFLALVDFTFEFRCWMWGKFPQILAFDGCAKVACNFGTKDQFVVGAGETVGSSPAWVSPDLRVSERFRTSQRGVLQDDDDLVKAGNGALLVEMLQERKMGIDNVSAMSSAEPEQLVKACWSDGGAAKFSTEEAQIAILKKLHAFWDSEGNPHRGSCSKMFMSRERGVTEGVFAAFTPSKVMVMSKTIVTSESPRDFCDMVRASKQPPNLSIYNAGCLAVPHLERDCPGVLKDRGRPTRLGDEERKEGDDEGTGEGNDDGRGRQIEEPDGAGNVGPKQGRVCIPSMAYLASDRKRAGVEGTRVILPAEPEVDSASDVYALRNASEPKRVQSQVNVHDLLWSSAEFLGPVYKLCHLAATRAATALLREGVRVLSVFEVLVFTYHWHRRAAKDGSRTSVLGADGWALQGDSPAGVNIAGGAPVQGEGGGGPGGFVSNETAANSLGVLLVVAVGARTGEVPSLPELGGLDVLVDSETSKVFSTLLVGLRKYSQAKTKFLVNGLGAVSDFARNKAESAISCGVGGGDGIFSIKALQIALCMNVVPHKSAEDGLVDGYKAIWQDTSFAKSNLSKFRLWTTGMVVVPNAPHENNHSIKCQRAYGGFSTCLEIAGVNLNPHEQDHSKKPIYFRSIDTMTFPNFTFALRVINERQNQGYNRQTLKTKLEAVKKHPTYAISTCEKALWRCGRCFCTEPVMRVFDCLGRVDVVIISAALARSI